MMKRIILAIIFSLLLCSGAWAGQMVLNLDMEELSGNLNSKATGGIVCTANGNPVYAQTGAPNRGKAISFDGNGDFFDCGNSSLLDATTGITVMVWCNIPPNNPNIAPMVTKTVYGGTASQQSWSLINYTTAGLYGIISNGTTTCASSKYPIVPNKWFSFSVTYANNTLILYRNASVLQTKSCSSFGNINVTTANVRVAAANNQSASTLYIGLIDSVKVYNYALTATEIQHEYQQSRVTTELRHEPWKFTDLYKLAFHKNGGALHEKDRRISYLRHITD